MTKVKSLLTRTGLLLASTVVVLLAAEGILRVVPLGSPQPHLTEQPDTLVHCVPDSILGWRLPANAQGTFHMGNYPTLISANAWGLRNPPVDAEDLTRFRVLILGNSCAFGWGVCEDEAFPRQLEAMLRGRYPDRNVEVINAAIPGYCTCQQIAMLRLIMKQTHVDAVISTFSLSNDPVDELRISRFLPDNLLAYSGDLRSPESTLARIISWSRLLSLLNKRTLGLQFFLANLRPCTLELAQESIADLANICTMRDLDLLLVIVPRRSEVVSRTGLKGFLIRRLVGRERAAVEAAVDANQIPAVDITGTLVEVERDTGAFLTGDVHWTPASHTAVAATILEAFSARCLRE